MPEYLNLVKPWKTGPARELLKTRVFSVFTRPSSSATDPARSGDFVHLACPDWVNVLAMTPANQVVMVEQYRHGLDRVTLEVPGGIAEPGEAPGVTCARELLEETGYSGDPCRIVGRVSANPAIQNNWVHIGLVRNADLRGPTNPDEHEEIGVRLVPLSEVPGLIRQGVIHHAFVVAAFHFLMLAGA
jgi:8-oxo-dGTP pyrophosphatase MutT (NUDIX family)